MSATLGVRSATPADEATVVGVITLAFSTDPMARWAFGDTQRYLAVMPDFVRALGGNGLSHGATHLVEGGWGAATARIRGSGRDSVLHLSCDGTYAAAAASVCGGRNMIRLPVMQNSEFRIQGRGCMLHSAF